jgi:hypothetical protein
VIEKKAGKGRARGTGRGVRPALVGARRFCGCTCNTANQVRLTTNHIKLAFGEDQIFLVTILPLAQSPSSKINNIAAVDCASGLQFPRGMRRSGYPGAQAVSALLDRGRNWSDCIVS